MNTNSCFQPIGAGDGNFWNDSTSTNQAFATSSLTTGGYGKVVQTRPATQMHPTPPSQPCTVPGTPASVDATQPVVVGS